MRLEGGGTSWQLIGIKRGRGYRHSGHNCVFVIDRNAWQLHDPIWSAIRLSLAVEILRSAEPRHWKSRNEAMESITRRTFVGSVAASMAFAVNGQLAFSQEVSGAEQMRIRESLAGRLAASLPSFDGTFVFDQSVCR